MKIRLIDEIKEVWTYSSMRVQYLAGSLLTTWLLMPEEYRNALLSAAGLTPERLALGGAFLWLLANLGTRTTVVERQ